MASFHDKPNHKVTYNYLLMKFILALTVAAAAAFPALAQRSDTALKNWEFSKDSTSWQNVTIPHDWAIYGPFDRKYDLQNVAVEQNGETEKTWKTGRTGGLPYIGKGFYKTTVNIPDTAGRSNALVFDGAMSNAHVYVNGHLAAFWPYGYNSFYVNLDGLARPGENNIEVSLENKPQSSRWYPGAGLYRNVHLVSTDRVHIPVWGTILTTPYVSKEYATVMLRTELEGVSKGEDVTLSTLIKDASGKTVVSDRHDYKIYPGVDLTQNFVVRNPSLWTPETPTPPASEYAPWRCATARVSSSTARSASSKGSATTTTSVRSEPLSTRPRCAISLRCSRRWEPMPCAQPTTCRHRNWWSFATRLD